MAICGKTQKGGKEVPNTTIPQRSAGVLLHIASLPGGYGIGTLGESARRFADFLHAAGVRYWQVLPLVQTGYGDSPYQSVFGASGNPYLLDVERLVAEGLLRPAEVRALRRVGDIDYGFLYNVKFAVLRRAFSRFDVRDPAFAAFVEGGGFHEYALFMALKEAHGGASFDRWKKEYRLRDPAALERFLSENRGEYLFWLFLQYEFRRQWEDLRAYVNGLGIRFIGDIPLYVAADSADVWANAHLFKLNKNRTARRVAGVPPDYFSATGQLWGNPVYDWKAHAAEGYAWWVRRIRAAFSLYDVVRIDHFRGLDRYYEVEAGAATAEHGCWRRGPGMKLFAAAERALGELPFIAEDLGQMDGGVLRLLRRSGFPGMKILQFAFDGNPDNPYLPHNIPVNSVCYTGTHDNDTSLGFMKSLPADEFVRVKARLRAAMKQEGVEGRIVGRESAAKALGALCWASAANLAVLPAQDLLLLGGEARMNTPAVGEGNWRFRLRRDLPASLAQRLRAALEGAGRV